MLLRAHAWNEKRAVITNPPANRVASPRIPFNFRAFTEITKTDFGLSTQTFTCARTRGSSWSIIADTRR